MNKCFKKLMNKCIIGPCSTIECDSPIGLHLAGRDYSVCCLRPISNFRDFLSSCMQMLISILRNFLSNCVRLATRPGKLGFFPTQWGFFHPDGGELCHPT